MKNKIKTLASSSMFRFQIKKILSFSLSLIIILLILPENILKENDTSINGIKIYEKSIPCSTTLSSSSSSNKELNWYYVQREKNKVPEQPKESEAYLKDLDAYYVSNTSDKVLYLTFDEGYEKGYTNSILDTLKDTDVKAAFFVVKPYIDSEPDIIKRMINEGHLVCNHSNHHPSMPTITDSDKFNKEFTDVEEAYKSLTDEEMTKFFRPPMGKYSKASLEKTKELGYKTIFWSFAYKDWFTDDQPSKEYAMEKIKNGVHPGAIMLLHAVSKTNNDILKDLITDLKNEGYEFKSLNELE